MGARPCVDNAMVKARARAFRWRTMVDTGVHATLEDLSRTNAVALCCLCRVVGLTLLAPEIVEAILDGRQLESVTLPGLMKGFVVEWERQRAWRARPAA